MENECKVCGATDETAEFYSGVRTRCKECHKRRVKENRHAKADYYREYDAKRFKEDPKVRLRHKRYQSTEAGKASVSKSREKWLSENPEKRAAHVIFGNALRGGKVSKPDICTSCGKKATGRKMQAHHHDYTKPLDVIWLCSMCHSKEHRKD